MLTFDPHHAGGQELTMQGFGDTASKNASHLLFDIGDLLSYFKDSPNPSGIQRVTVNLIAAFLEGGFYPAERIRLILYSETTGAFVEVPKRQFMQFIANLRKPARERRNEVAAPMLAESVAWRSLNLADAELDDAFLILTGAAWGYKSLEQVFGPLVRRGIRIISFIYDIIPLKYPAYFGPELYASFRRFLFFAHHNFDAWIFISEFTRREVCDFYASQGISIVPHAVAPLGASRFAEPNRGAQPERPYVLIVSTLIHTKNHIQILRAWHKLAQQPGRSLPKLLLVGRYGTHIEETLAFLENTNFVDGQVEIRQNVSDEELASLYANCLFTIFPSLYEGWGLPVSESLAYGKPCLCSNAASLPEAGGEFCDYFTPGDDSTLMPALERLLFDDNYRKRREEKICAEYAPINWNEQAQKILGALNLAKGGRSKSAVLPPGEYSFAAIDGLLDEEKMKSAGAVDAHANNLAGPAISMHDHFLAESAIVSGRYGAAEAWGRWGERKGTVLEFHLADSGKQYLVYLQLSFLPEMLPCSIQYWHNGSYLGGAPMRRGDEVIYLDSATYASNGLFSLELRPVFPEEFKDPNLGIGFRNMVIVERDDLMRRVRILERLFMRG